MKKNKKQVYNIEKKRKNYDKGQVFVKVTAGFLALLMVVATAASLIFALFG